ncbi:MAG: hypothetical protein KJ077_30670 [Anaerolineae bacterium]|nr:hypothetical protein [Anaerolineae bacterium]
MITRKLSLSIVLVLSLGLVLAGVVYAAGNIDAANKYAWGSNVGWINFNPTHGGVTVYADHLEGYAWAENIGWIRLGTCTGGSPCTYANTSPTNYGVNRAADGKLSGYAWSTTAGWIKFNPTHGGVTVDPATGAFNGYAWAENVGWIHFKGGAGATAYGVVTSFGGSTPSQPLNLALDFDGSNDYVTIADADSLDLTSNYTLEAWIYPNSFGYLEGIISKYHTNNANGYTLRVTASGGIDFDQMSTAGGLLTPNQWYHIAAVNSGGTRSLYINGLPVTLSGTPITVGANNNPVRIGQDFGTTGPARYFDGLIDEARIWNTARTAADIGDNMYRELSGAESGLVAYYNLNESGSSTTANDLAGSDHNGALTNMALPNGRRISSAFGGPKNVLDFDGSNDYVTIADADSLDLTSNYTLEAWIYPNSFGYLEGIISKYHTNNANGYTLRVTASGGIDFDQMSTAGGLLTPNQWYHIAAVNSGGTRSLYINGLPVTLSGTPITVGANNNPVRIGQDFGTTGPARYFDGLIDEARIWNTARTAQQIRENMARALLGSETGLVGYWRMDYGLPGSANPGLTTLPDLTANNHDGALTNFALSGNTSNWVGSTAFNTWFGSYDTAWATGGNWSRNAAPAASDTVGVYSYGGYNPAIGAAANARDLIIASGGVLTVNGSNTLNIGSRFINYGTFTSNSSSVVFNGSGSQYLILGAATAFNHLTVNAGVTLIETEAANNATVNGTLTNHGVIRKVQAIPTTGAYTFGLAGGPVNGANVGLNVTGDSFSAIQVDRRDNSHPSAPSKIQTGRYWTITPSGTGTVNLTLPATFTADSSSQVCRYTGSGQVWDCARTSNTANSVTRDGVTTFSDWAVSQETVKTYLPFIIK